MRHTFQWLPDPALDLSEADVLAELPALTAWVSPDADPRERELVSELPSLLALGSFAR
jgi:hypothetical protein